MLTDYIDAAMRHAQFKILPDDGNYFGEIPGFQGVWAYAPTIEECREELREVLEEWIVYRLTERLRLPTVDGIELAFGPAV
jgi:predicted RNase H-like HicB family nuclease